MVFSKGNVRVNRVAQDLNQPPPWRHAGVRSFKVRSDCDADTRGKAVPVMKQKTVASSSDLKAKEASGDVLNGKGKGKGKTNVGRKALGDISNINKSLPENMARDGRKSMILTRQRATTLKVASKKSSMKKTMDGMSQGTSDRLEAVGVKHAEASSGCGKTNVKNTAARTSIANGRVNARNPCLLTRKSLPVLRRVDKVESKNTKEMSGGSVKSKGTKGFPVKAKLARNALPRTNNAKDHLWKHRVSDGCILTAKSDANKDSRALFQKSIMPAMRTAVKAANAQRSSKPVGIIAPKRSTHVASLTSNNKEETQESASPCMKSVQVDLHDMTLGEMTSDAKTSPAMKTLEVSVRKSQRRRSFTSMLMKRSKLLEDSGVATKEEELPNIDDDRNHLEVAEYVDDIYMYYWAMEAQNVSLEGYLSIQTEISPHMRGILINWLIEVHLKFDLMQETLYLMVTLLDRYLSLVTIKKNEMQLVGLSALLVASKYEDYWHPRVKDLISISAESYKRDQVLTMERLILNKLKFRLNAPTPYVFMIRFLKAARSSTKLEHLAFYLIELCLVEHEALKFKPSMLCAAAIFVANCTLQTYPPWTPLLVKHTRYEVSKIRECADKILKFHKGARKRQLSVTYGKYARPELNSVALIRPLAKLPQ